MSSRPAAMAKASRTEPAPLAGLLEEIVVWEILVRLPPDPLLRCRAVCRSWRRQLASAAFLLRHHHHQPSLPLLVGYQYGSGCYLDILVLDRRAADPAAQLVPVARHRNAAVRVAASCDGILILSMLFGQYFFVCNPVTGEVAAPRVICGFSLMGFYRHRPTGEYRLLLYRGQDQELMQEDLVPGARDSCYIFALGGDLPPRCIGWPLSARTPCRGTSVLVRGSLHWGPMLHQSGGGMITVFDTMAESFRTMQAPIVLKKEPLLEGDTCLFEMDGTLGMYTCNDGELRRVDIWVLQDYEREVWAFKYRVELPMTEIRNKFDGCEGWRAMVIAEEADVLVLVYCNRWLLHVDTEGKLQASFHRDGQGLMTSPHMLKQSLVQHAFFPKLDDYVQNV
ncbi:hypothetical protein ACP70R_006520 [Stipagrostis hirtigluma subsp. patula]